MDYRMLRLAKAIESDLPEEMRQAIEAAVSEAPRLAASWTSLRLPSPSGSEIFAGLLICAATHGAGACFSELSKNAFSPLRWNAMEETDRKGMKAQLRFALMEWHLRLAREPEGREEELKAIREAAKSYFNREQLTAADLVARELIASADVPKSSEVAKAITEGARQAFAEQERAIFAALTQR